jgi:tetratricopeptide (TPR) repeat protein
MVLCFSCTHGNVKGRFISEKDTSFSQDIRDISAKINKNPDKANLYYLRGNAFFYQDKFKDASTDFETAVQLDSLNATYHFRLGESLLKQDTAESKLARTHLLTAVRLAPELWDAKLQLAKLYVARQEYPLAESLLKEMVPVADMADKALLLMGIVQKEKKDTTLSLVSFDKALQINPKNYDAAMQIALIKSAQNDKNQLQYFDRVLAINEYSDEAWYGKGLCYYRQKEYKNALACFDKTTAINPLHKMSRYNSALIFSIFEDWGRAEEWCNKALDLDPKFANALALRGFVAENKGNKKAAEADYRAALNADPNNLPAIKGLKALGY